MNTWRDIKTAPTKVVIFACVGTGVAVGTLRDYGNGDFVFNGHDLQNGIGVLTMRENLDGWQPVPDTWKQPEKTADEMFKDISFVPRGEVGDTVVYTTDDYEEAVKVGEDYVQFFGRKEGEELQVEKGLILACAQLIREMEQSHG